MSFNLQKIEGQECPRCGCEDTAEVQPGRYACAFCGRQFGVAMQAQSRIKYLEKRIPICPVHNIPMHNNGKPAAISTRGERSVYYKCPCPNCTMTSKGGERIT